MGIYDISELDLNKPEEIITLPADTEAQLMITSADEGISSNSGLPWMRFNCEVVDQPNVKDITIFITWPNATKQEPKKYAGTYKAFMAFREAFKINGAFQPTDLIGRKAWAILKTKDDGEYGMKNEVKRWVTDR